MGRLVLYPQGAPPDRHLREHCAEVVVRCGGDVQRTIDAPAHSVDAFAKHLARTKAFRRREVAIVVLTETNPVALKLVQARRTLEQLIEPLREASWLVYFNPLDDPFFMETASMLGDFDDADADVPIWTGPEKRRFLILCPAVDDPAIIERRMQDLEKGSPDAASGVVQKRSLSSTSLEAVEQDGVDTQRPPKIGC